MITTTDPDFGARSALRLLGPDPENWVSDRPGIDHNVTIVGGSGSGSVFAFALRRVGIGRVSAIDAAEDEAHAGVWLTRARMKKLRTVIRVRGYPGAYYNYPQLPDEARWFQAWRFRQAGSTPPPDAIERAVAFSNFHLHLSAPWRTAQEKGGRIVAQVNDDIFEFDFVIAGTGYFVDPTKRPELADFAHHIALWRDRYEPPADQRDDDLGTHPYLGSAHEYLEKVPGTAPYLKDIHVFNPAGFVSFGLPIGDVPSIRRDVPAIVGRISHDLFFADWEQHEARITSDNIAPDFQDSLYAKAVWKQSATVAVS